MKKFLSMVVGVMVGLAASFSWADTTSTYTNKLGQVVTVVTTSAGVKTTTISSPNAPSAMASFSTAAQSDTTTNTTTASYTPRYRGDVLLGQVTGTNAVWVAVSATTNGWVQVAP